MEKQPLRNILFEITVAKQRVKQFKDNPRKSADVLKQLFNLYEEIYKRQLFNAGNIHDGRVLVFTESSPDGIIITRSEYYDARLKMTKFDLETHVLVELDTNLMSEAI